MAKTPRLQLLLSWSTVTSSPLAVLKAHFTLNYKWKDSWESDFGQCDIFDTPSEWGLLLHTEVACQSHWYLNPESEEFKTLFWPHFAFFFKTVHIPDLVTWSVCSTRANPVEFDHVKTPASLSQQEESRDALCMGLRRNFSKDDPESRTHNAARKTQHSRRGTNKLEVRGTPAETATDSTYRKTEHYHGAATRETDR